jgi:ubiquinone/menaquinone biosynthesis C-methylase UbiE
MSYNGFAYHYDKMMADVDYSWWTQTIEENLAKGSRVLDVGCGTGTLSLSLTDLGYDVTGLDLSEDMLVVATEKVRKHKIGDNRINFIHRDMRELDGLSGFDCVLIAVDSLNYLENEADVRRTIAGAYTVIDVDGLLIFDVHTPHKMTETFKDYLYVENDDDLTYIWHVEEGEYPLSIVHELTIFAKNKDGSYRRTIEYHYQRTFEVAQYEAWLAEAGFKIISINGDEDRQLFVAKKVG